VNLADLSKPLDEDNIKVTMHDFIQALNEVKPAFGAAINSLEMCRYVSPTVDDGFCCLQDIYLGTQIQIGDHLYYQECSSDV
jgi:hypothetical protein